MKLSDEQIGKFQEDGVLVAEGVLQDSDLQPVIADYEGWIDRRARELHEEGAITDLAEGLPFDRRYAVLFSKAPKIADGMDLMYARLPGAFAFLKNPNLLDAVECLVGPEIVCSPIQHIRAKPPASSSGEGTGFYNVPWHQDAGVTWEDTDDSNIVTCWIPLVDATVENGCMEVLPGVWKSGYLEHQAEGGTTIRPDLMPGVAPVAVPVHKGGIIFMHRHTPHRSTPNYSNSVRWSIDLRYQPAGTPTGRPFHPDFVARSRRSPSAALSSHADWSRLWQEALSSPVAHRAHRVK